MKSSKLEEIKKELDKLIEYRAGTGMLKDSYFGEYQGTSVTLTFDGNYSSIWVGRLDENHNPLVSTYISDCELSIVDGQIKFLGKDFIVAVGEIK